MIPPGRRQRLARVSELIVAQYGLHFPAERLGDLQRALLAAARRASFAGVDALLEFMVVTTPRHWPDQALLDALTIGETYFFRDPQIFALLGEHFVPELRRRRGAGPFRLRAWSAGCCTGEEAYTLAIVFDRLRAGQPDCRVELLATDINPSFLRHARVGIYRPWSFRGAPAWLQHGYFHRLQGERFELRADLRARVEFAPLNLSGNEFPAEQNGTSGLDLILCRHVLMYFSPSQRACTVDRLALSLCEGGWLVVSAAEVSQITHPALVPLRVGEATVLVKQSEATRRAPAAADHAVAVGAWAGWPPELAPSAGWELELRTGPHVTTAGPPERHGAGGGGVVPREPPAGNARVSRPPVAAPHGAAAATPAQADAAAGGADAIALTRALAGCGDLDGALEWCQEALWRDKLNPIAHYLIAGIRLERGEVTEAEQALRRALYLDPRFIAAHVSLAGQARATRRPVLAERHSRTALALARQLPPEAIVPESEGLTARQLVGLLQGVGAAEPAGGAGGRTRSMPPAIVASP